MDRLLGASGCALSVHSRSAMWVWKTKAKIKKRVILRNCRMIN